MLKLLSTDLRRILKDKLFIIVIILGAVFSIIVPGLYKVLDIIMDLSAGEDVVFMDAKTATFSSLGPLSDFGLILPIFVSILVYKDFSYGTIRNKIISGKTRTSIFLSIFITSAIIVCGIMLVYSLLVLMFCAIFLGNITASLGYMITSFIFVLLVYLSLAALICFFCVTFKNAAASIIFYVVLGFVGSILLFVCGQGSLALSTNPDFKWLADILEFLNYCNIYYLITGVIGLDTTYTAAQVAACIITPIVFTGLLVGFSILIFRRKDLK